MIFDSIENIGRYKSVDKNILEALNYLSTVNVENFSPGQRLINDKELFANFDVNNTQPADEMMAENHRVYIDIHFMVEGAETIEFVSATNQTADQVYDAEEDYELYKISGQPIELKVGYFLILFPGEVHKPGIGSGQVKKVIMKVKSQS